MPQPPSGVALTDKCEGQPSSWAEGWYAPEHPLCKEREGAPTHGAVVNGLVSWTESRRKILEDQG